MGTSPLTFFPPQSLAIREALLYYTNMKMAEPKQPMCELLHTPATFAAPPPHRQRFFEPIKITIGLRGYGCLAAGLFFEGIKHDFAFLAAQIKQMWIV